MKTSLEKLRQKIDQIDADIIEKLAQRFEITGEIGEIKKISGLPALDPERYSFLITDRKKMGKKLGLSEELVQEIFELIHKYSVDQQK